MIATKVPTPTRVLITFIRVVKHVKVNVKFHGKINFYLKGHGNEADFLGFLHEWVRHRGTLHYILSRSDFDFEFTEIFVIEK